MTPYSIRAAVLAAGLLAAGAAQAATVIVANGDFEAGASGAGLVNGANFADLPTTGPDTDVFAALDGWTTVAGTGSGVQVLSDRSVPGLQAQSGDYFVTLDSGERPAIRQSVRLNVSRYLLSFWYSPETSAVRTNSITFTLGGLAGGTISTGTNGAAQGAWTLITYEFLSPAVRRMNLTFRATGLTDGIGGYLDNISIVPVPVPASGAALLGAVGALAFLRRRRKTA